MTDIKPMTRLEEALKFREIFGQLIVGKLDTSTDELKDLWNLQIDLIKEESQEFLDAVERLGKRHE